MVAGKLQLEHYFIVALPLRPRRGQSLQELRAADQEQTVALHLPQPDLRRILPRDRAPGDARGLLGECPLRELVRPAHGICGSRTGFSKPDVGPSLGGHLFSSELHLGLTSSSIIAMLAPANMPAP